MTITPHDFEGKHSMTFDAGDLAADAAVAAAGHEPNGVLLGRSGAVRLAGCR
ncbi:hypothetical protein [Streptomyces sp. NPDC007904]|uniref:hypothetical protein n=1 Tax=Streptomyces sp. NPDC007904 TaxID=3364787 RepID=UPI0036EE98BE